MSHTVPASTSIRRSRVGNIDTDRLERRRPFIIAQIENSNKEFDRRADFIARVAELVVIERELVARGVLTTEARKTREFPPNT